MNAHDPQVHEPMPEGEEHAPPGVRTMAIVRWALVAAMALAAAGSWAAYTGAFAAIGGARQEALFHCPMHPSVIQDRPGECPICGMDLVPVAPADGDAGAHAGHDHGDEEPQAVHEPDGIYACPMRCADFRTNDPDARCPECGMRMERIDGVAEEGVPGLVPVMISGERIQLIGMKTATVEQAALAPELRTVGFVAADESRQERVHTRFSGWIEGLRVNETGQRVKKGEVLASIYSPDLLTAQQEFLAARGWAGEGEGARLVADARRRLELLGISGAEIDRIARTGEPLRALPIRAPRTGHVIRKAAIEGVFVQPGAELFELADLSRIWVLADVHEHDLGRVKPGAKAAVTVSAYPGRTFEGKVAFLYPTVDATTRTMRVRVELPNPELLLKPGMYGEVKLALPAALGLAIPREALVDTGDHRYVFVARREGVFEPRQVTVGVRTGGRVEILGGLAEGETVVTTGNFLLDSESRLRAAVEGASAAPAGGPGHGHGAAVAADPDAVPANGGR